MYLEANTIENVKNLFNVFKTLDFVGIVTAIIEIIMIAVVIYYMLAWIKNTRAWTLLRGVIIIAFFVFIAWAFNFRVILKILQSLTSFALIALIIVFQSDIRAALEHLGRQKFFTKFIPDLNKLTKKTSDSVVQEIAEAVFAMGKVKTGALIVIEQKESLEEVERTGITINGKVSKQLLINIFEKNTPLHDGAVLIVGDIIKAATCYLPLTKNTNISKDLGTRHRAALGVSEISDSQTIVVSEETGKVSICARGKITVVEEEKELIKILMDTIYEEQEVKKKGWLFL